MQIPFDGIITLFVFLVGLPALIVQFMSPEVRKVVFDKGELVPGELKRAIYYSMGIVIIASAINFTVDCFINDSDLKSILWNIIWLLTLASMGVIVGVTTFKFQSLYGRRENVIKHLKEKVYKFMAEHDDRPGGDELRQLIAIGKQSEPGFDRELILQALKEITSRTCASSYYRGEALMELIDGVVEMLSTSPDAEDLLNYKTAVELLKIILRAEIPFKDTTLQDQQHSVRALSALGQTVISEIKIQNGVDYILMDYEETLGRSIYRHPQLLTDISQAFLEVGAVALQADQILFAVAALRRLLLVARDPPRQEENESSVARVPFEAVSDILGLMAHFWTFGESGQNFVRGRLVNLEKCLEHPLLHEIERSRDHCVRTMEFSTADKLALMGDDLKRERGIKKVKSNSSRRKT